MRPLFALCALALVGCVAVDEVPVVDFGPVEIGLEWAQHVALGADGEAPRDARIVEGTLDIWSVGALETDSVEVRFAPQRVGPHRARLEVLFDDRGVEVELRALAVGTVDGDGDGVPLPDDCDDRDPRVYPGAPEAACDGVDGDCSGDTAELDLDDDGYAVCEGDCDDEDFTVHPGAPERCDAVDSDCDGFAGGADSDSDGFRGCDGDCRDGDRRVFPSAQEECDDGGLDRDCSGDPDDRDNDGDGFSPCARWGDCDDESRVAHPVLVRDGPAEGDGTPTSPFGSLVEALESLDGVCNLVDLGEGDFRAGVVIDGRVTLQGLGRDRTRVDTPPGEIGFDVVEGGSLSVRDAELLSGFQSAIRVTGGSVALERVRVRAQAIGDQLLSVGVGGYLSVVDDSELRGVCPSGNSGTSVGVKVTSGQVFIDDSSVERVGSALTLAAANREPPTVLHVTHGRIVGVLEGFKIVDGRSEQVRVTSLDSRFLPAPASSPDGCEAEPREPRRYVIGKAGSLDLVRNCFVGSTGTAISADGPVDIRNNLVVGAIHEDETGGGMRLDCGARGVVAHNTFVAPFAPSGSAISGGDDWAPEHGETCGELDVHSNVVAGADGPEPVGNDNRAAIVLRRGVATHNSVEALSGVAFGGVAASGEGNLEELLPLDFDPEDPCGTVPGAGFPSGTGRDGQDRGATGGPDAEGER